LERCYITELANTPEDPEASIAVARVSRGVTTRWHRLVGTTERYVILEGRGRVEVGDLPAQGVSAGAVVRIPPLHRPRTGNVGERSHKGNGIGEAPGAAGDAVGARDLDPCSA